MWSFQLNIYCILVWKRDTIGVTEEQKLVRTFLSSVVPQIIIFPKTKKSYTTVLRGHRSHVKVSPFAGQRQYLHFSVILGPWVLQWRIQGRNPGGPAPPPLIFRPNWGPKGRRTVFWRPPPPPHLIYGSGWPPPLPHYLKVWIRHCIGMVRSWEMNPWPPSQVLKWLSGKKCYA